MTTNRPNRPTTSLAPVAARWLLLGGCLAGPVLALSAGTAAAAPAPLPTPAHTTSWTADQRAPQPQPGSAHDEAEEYGGLSAGRIEAYETYLAADDARSEALAAAFPAGSGVTAHRTPVRVPVPERAGGGLPTWGVAGTTGVGIGLLAGLGLAALTGGRPHGRRPVRPV